MDYPVTSIRTIGQTLIIDLKRQSLELLDYDV